MVGSKLDNFAVKRSLETDLSLALNSQDLIRVLTTVILVIKTRRQTI